MIERAPARIKPPSGRNKKVFLGSHPNPQCHKRPRGTAKQACKHNTHPHPPTVSRAFKPPFTDIFWPGSAHVNSRGKTVTYFQNSSRSKSGPQVETELAQRYDLTHDRSRTHSHLRELWRPYKGIIYYLWLAKDSYKSSCQIYTARVEQGSADRNHYSFSLP